jgi:hypothetical protein
MSLGHDYDRVLPLIPGFGDLSNAKHTAYYNILELSQVTFVAEHSHMGKLPSYEDESLALYNIRVGVGPLICVSTANPACFDHFQSGGDPS